MAIVSKFTKVASQTLSSQVAVLFAIFPLVLAGCASNAIQEDSSQPAKTVKVEKAALPNAAGDSIAAHGTEAFMNSDKLTDEQKQKLMNIHTETFRESQVLRAQLIEAKVALFKTLASGSASKKEINLLKTKIVEVDKKRLNLMFKALEQVQAVIGVGKDVEEIYRRFYDFDRPRHSEFSKVE